MDLGSDVIILEADGLIDEKHGYGTPIANRLEEFGIRSTMFHVEPNIDRLDTLSHKPLIISGGMTEVTADIDWIHKFKTFVLNIINKNIEQESIQPIFGICFGAQLLVEAFSPGSVRYLDDPEIGISKIILDIHEHALFKGIDKEFDAYSFHYNQIWSDDVVVISDHLHEGHKFIQAFEIPEANVYGVQFHPEFSYAEMLQLFKTYKQLIAELGFDLSPIIQELPQLDGNQRMLRNFLALYD
ncbi:MAG: type 1 glutamine amidotransferase [Candidatus Thorarchaeota archaeon]